MKPGDLMSVTARITCATAPDHSFHFNDGTYLDVNDVVMLLGHARSRDFSSWTRILTKHGERWVDNDHFFATPA